MLHNMKFYDTSESTILQSFTLTCGLTFATIESHASVFLIRMVLNIS